MTSAPSAASRMSETSFSASDYPVNKYPRTNTAVSIDLAGSTLTFQSSVNDLGVLIDSQLTMREHVQRVCRSSFYQLRQLRVIRSSLSMKTCTALVHAFVTSRLDYCNSLLSGINKELLNRLESVLRSAARLVLRNGNSIRSPTISETLCIGSRFARESSSNSASSSSSVCTVMPRPIWSSHYRWSRSTPLFKHTGPPPAVTS